MYTYLIINIASIAIPFLYSFHPGMQFRKDWKYLFPSLLIPGLIFIVWDVIFTEWGIWHFNETYITGIKLWGLPLEEWLFFFCIPYACVFIYDALRYYVKSGLPARVTTFITVGFLLLFLAGAFVYHGRMYTVVTLSACFLFLGIHYMRFGLQHLGRFYMAYALHLIPFFIVNGILTSLPVVLYNNQENIGVRIGTIPVEDSMYSFLLLLMNVTVYEELRHGIPAFKRSFKP